MNIQVFQFENDSEEVNAMDVDLVALMMACNDLQTATECLVNLNKESDNIQEEKITIAKRIYFIRLICGHLNEGLNSFYRLHLKKEIEKTLQAFTPEEKENFYQLKLSSSSNGGLRLKHLKSLRNDACFHYLEEPIKNSIRLFLQESKTDNWKEVIIRDGLFDSRYLIADNILSGVFGINIDNKGIENSLNSLRDFLEQLFTEIRDVEFKLIRFLKSFLDKSKKVKSQSV